MPAVDDEPAAPMDVKFGLVNESRTDHHCHKSLTAAAADSADDWAAQQGRTRSDQIGAGRNCRLRYHRKQSAKTAIATGEIIPQCLELG